MTKHEMVEGEMGEYVPEALVNVTFTDKYDKYLTRSGAQINAGEAASVPMSEAELLVNTGAAVRMDAPEDQPTDKGKALSHPPKDKMVKGDTTK